jgi:hypothetical protein
MKRGNAAFAGAGSSANVDVYATICELEREICRPSEVEVNAIALSAVSGTSMLPRCFIDGGRDRAAVPPRARGRTRNEA